MQHPRIVILDEPFSGVGDAGITGIIRALQAIRNRGCAVLLVDHNVDLLTSVVDRMALLAQGEIVIDADVATCIGSERFRDTYIGVT
jgi:branched-chain amino acid transport system ATP-binding protein